MKNKKRWLALAGFVPLLLLLFLLRKAVARVLVLTLCAAIQAYLSLPLVKRVEKHLPRTAAILVTYGLLLTVNVLALFLLVPVLIRQVRDLWQVLPDYLSRLEALAAELTARVPMAGRFLEKLPDLPFLPQSLPVPSPGELITFFSTALLIPVVMFYLLRDRERVRRAFLFAVPEKIRPAVSRLAGDINRQLRDYVSGEYMIVLVVSLLMAFFLAVFGFEYWLLLGVVMGLFNVIPYLGPVLGSLPILLSASREGWPRLLLALGLILLVQQVDNLIIQPRVISFSVRIHPVAVLLCVTAGGALGGLIGLLLAIPLYIVARILVRECYRYFSERNRKFLKNQ